MEGDDETEVMKLKVKLFGTLTRRFPAYNSEEGLEVEIPDGARVKDLLAHLKISGPDTGIVIVEGHIKGAEEELHEKSKIFSCRIPSCLYHLCIDVWTTGTGTKEHNTEEVTGCIKSSSRSETTCRD